MRHPFLSNQNKAYYSIVWLFISGLYTLVLSFSYDYPINEALVDSLVFNGLFASLGLAFWFVVRYNDFNPNQIINFFASHAAAAGLSIAAAIFLSLMVLSSIFPGDEEYQIFLQESVPWRAGLGLMYYSITILVYHMIKYYDDLTEKAKSQSQLETMLRDSELEMLKSQINPHFIFNSLNSISSLTITAPERARDMVIKLSEFLRYSLGKENHQLNSVQEELNNIWLYLDIEKVRFGDRLNIEKALDPNTLQMQLPNLILQPLLENSIKHGIYESLEQITVKIKTVIENDILRIFISNEYDPNAVSKKGEGIGIKNVSHRLELIYGVPKLVFTTKSENLFTVRLDIPQQKPEA